MSALAPLLEGTRLLVCVGPGGVGKTSLAAALALQAARRGRRVLLLTIDPARRLADALSMTLSDEGSSFPVGAGLVHAAMLETETSWDRFVERTAPDPEARARILANPVYRAFSRTLARSHAYVAMERLHHALGERDASGAARWDLVVLDTPPIRSALDVLDAPGSLARFADEGVASAFVAGASTVLRPGAALARRALGWLMGPALAAALTEFLAAFAPLRAGFAQRSAEIASRLRAPETSFVLVAAPLAAQLADARFLRDDLARRGIALRALLFNRARHARPAALTAAPPEPARVGALLAGLPGVSPEEARALAAALADHRARRDAEDRAAIDAIRRFGTGGNAIPVFALPRLLREPCSVEELLALADAARPIDAGAGPGA